MTPKPESETDPWKAIQRYEFVQTNFAYTTDHEMERDAEGEWARWEAVDAARAAEAAQHRQEMSQQAAHIANLEHMVREHGQFGDLFQPGGRFHKEAQLEPGSVAVVAGGKWLVARLAAVEAERDNQYTQAVEATQRALLAEVERDRLKAALTLLWREVVASGNAEAANHGWPEAKRAVVVALTPQGQSTDGETR